MSSIPLKIVALSLAKELASAGLATRRVVDAELGRITVVPVDSENARQAIDVLLSYADRHPAASEEVAELIGDLHCIWRRGV